MRQAYFLTPPNPTRATLLKLHKRRSVSICVGRLRCLSGHTAAMRSCSGGAGRRGSATFWSKAAPSMIRMCRRRFPRKWSVARVWGGDQRPRVGDASGRRCCSGTADRDPLRGPGGGAKRSDAPQPLGQRRVSHPPDPAMAQGRRSHGLSDIQAFTSTVAISAVISSCVAVAHQSRSHSLPHSPADALPTPAMTSTKLRIAARTI